MVAMVAIFLLFAVGETNCLSYIAMRPKPPTILQIAPSARRGRVPVSSPSDWEYRWHWPPGGDTGTGQETGVSAGVSVATDSDFCRQIRAGLLGTSVKVSFLSSIEMSPY